MTDRDALLAAVRAAPAEDTPRLIFADWLEEHGENAGTPWSIAPAIRASLVRVQLEQARSEPHGPAARAAYARAATMLKPLRSHWSKYLPRQVIGTEFGRGFIERVTVDAATFPPIAEAVLDTEPIRALQITRFRTSSGRVSLEPLFDVPRLTRIEELDLSAQDLTDRELHSLFSNGPLANLRSLAMRQSAVTAKAIITLLASSRLPRLNTLDLRDNPQFLEGLAAGWSSYGHRRFTSLDLSRVRLSRHEIAAMLEAPCTDGLEELRLAAPPNAPADGSDLAAVLAASPNLRKLRVLDLAGMMIGDTGAEALAKSPYLTSLRVLNLAANGLASPAVKAFFRLAPWELFELNLRFNSVGFADIAALKERFPEAVVTY